jgi:hypothetical protein
VKSAPPTSTQMVLWVILAACGSGLLVATSTQLSTNVAPIPLLWVAPLALYLLTFILNFGQRRLYRRTYFLPALVIALACMAWLYTHGESHQNITYVIPLYLISLFAISMTCHGEIVYYRPPAAYLTRFYLLIALGGALGGIFVAVLAPLLFDTFLELPLLLIVVAELMVALLWRRVGARVTTWMTRVAMIVGVVALVGSLLTAEMTMRVQSAYLERNFYGMLRVRDNGKGDLARRSLINGTISHGTQFTSAARRDVATSYYAVNSGVGMLLETLEARGPIRYGVIGLGAGVLTSYARAGDYLRVYEINPAVANIARNSFTYLQRAEARGADVKVILGDARLMLEREEKQSFDALVVDAFSSDSIPVHLLTVEAMDTYFSHLKSDGVLAVHISNRYLDLTQVCLRAAEHANRTAVLIRNSADEIANASEWVLITSNRALLNDPMFEYANEQSIHADPSFRGWSDQYSSLWSVFRLNRDRSAGTTH